MAVSAEDRRRMTVIAESLAAIEQVEPPAPDAAAAEAAAAADYRERHGIAPLHDPDHERPEEEFYRRARALGFRRSGR